MHPHDIGVEVEREQAGAPLALWPRPNDGLEFKNLRSFAALRFGQCSRSAHVVAPAPSPELTGGQVPAKRSIDIRF
jgi:hypothetical protein